MKRLIVFVTALMLLAFGAANAATMVKGSSNSKVLCTANIFNHSKNTMIYIILPAAGVSATEMKASGTTLKGTSRNRD